MITQNTEQLLEEAQAQLKEAGFKNTAHRRKIIQYLVEDQRYHPAMDIYEHMSEAYPTMSTATIYRNLYDFTEIGLLEATEYKGEQLFRIHCGHEHEHHHHFICTECGATIALEVCPMDSILTDLTGVQVESHRFEVFGKCQKCSQKNAHTHS